MDKNIERKIEGSFRVEEEKKLLPDSEREGAHDLEHGETSIEIISQKTVPPDKITVETTAENDNETRKKIGSILQDGLREYLENMSEDTKRDIIVSGKKLRNRIYEAFG